VVAFSATHGTQTSLTKTWNYRAANEVAGSIIDLDEDRTLTGTLRDNIKGRDVVLQVRGAS
jgi:hypothetical protein